MRIVVSSISIFSNFNVIVFKLVCFSIGVIGKLFLVGVMVRGGVGRGLRRFGYGYSDKALT